MSRARRIAGVCALLISASTWAQAPDSDAGVLSPGWFMATKNEGAYLVESLAEGACGGRAAVVHSVQPSVEGKVSLMQVFRADKFRGNRVRVSATVDAKEVTGWAGLWMRVDGPGKKTLGFDNMQNRSIQGTAKCVKASVVLDVPSYAETIALGVVLNGGGRTELGNLALDAVDELVPVTNLAPPAEIKLPVVDAGTPAPQRERAKDPRDDVAMGRVGKVWFSDRIIVESASRALRPGSGELHLVSPNVWSDGAGDFTASLRGDTLLAKGLDPSIGSPALTAMTGEFKMHRDGDANVIEGTWGNDVKKFPVVIRVSRKKLDMSWGFWERHMTAEYSPQAPADCVFFTKRASPGLAIAPSDALQVCGDVFDHDAPFQQTVMAFLMTGFHRFDGY